MTSWRRRLGDPVLASTLVTRTSALVTRSWLRVLAYHDVRDGVAFARHVEHLAGDWHVVTAEQVDAALDGAPLPLRSVWLTFDDAHPDVVELAQPLLDARGLKATMFVCPAVVDTEEPFWWQVVDAAAARGLTGRVAPGMPAAEYRRRLKVIPDQERRDSVRTLAECFEQDTGRPVRTRQVTSTQLRRWLEGGHTVGNHTWDHPVLDTCAPSEQERQVEQAHAWLRELAPPAARMFAYPNGNRAAGADAALSRLGYRGALLFDHRLTRIRREQPLSRLRLDAFADERRLRAVVSGAHPLLSAAAGVLRRG